MAWKRPSVPVSSEINVTPLCDVMLVLLIIFMVITPMMQNAFTVRLAQAVNPVAMADASKTDAVVVGVSHDGHIYIGNDMISQNDVTTKVSTAIEKKLDKTVYIKADALAQFQIVAAVVDEIRAAGVDKVGLITQKVDRINFPPAIVGE